MIPVFVTFLLVFVSGIPLLEKQAEERWGETKAYQEFISLMEDDAVLLESAASASFDAFAVGRGGAGLPLGDASALAPLVPQLALRSQTLAQTLHASLQHVSLSGPALQTVSRGCNRPRHRCPDGWTVQEACTSGSVSTASSGQDLRYLVTLHEAKRRLQSCSQALVEAARWGVTCVRPKLLSHALKGDGAKLKAHTADTDTADNLADRVREMQASLDIEAAVQPRLATKLRRTISAMWRRCGGVLTYSAASIRRNATEMDEKGEKEESFANWLDSFYGDVLRMLQRESRNAQELFGADMLINVLLDLLHNTLEPLTKSFRYRLVHSGPSGTDFRLAYRLYFTEYARFTSEALTDALLRLVPAFNAKSNSKNFLETRYEEEDRDAADAAPLEDFSQRLEEASEAAWMLVDESLQQCYEFSGGAAFPEAVEAIGTAVQQFTLALSATIPVIRRHCKAEPAVQEEGTTSGSLVASPDWSQFHASLALLKACGTLESQLCALDGRVRVRMREQLAQFFGETSGSSSPRSRRKKSHDGSSIALADLVDPTKLVAAVSKTWLHDEDPVRQSQFHQFEMELLDHSAGSPGFDNPSSRYPTATLLDEAQRAVRSWTKEVQLFTYDSVFLPIARVLETLPANKLEPFAESAVSKAPYVASRGAQEVCVQSEWARLGQLLQLEPPELATCQRIFGSDGKSAAAEPAPTATEFVDLWTAAVASGTLAAFLRTVCSISMLSDMGAQQLAADLGYFHNVAERHDVRRALETDLPAHIQHVNELRADRYSPENQALAKINDCVAAMRQRALEPPLRLSTASGGSAATSAQFNSLF
ncbi:Conserved oligomeric Golgi complex subunit 7 [Phytophthora cactorum]|nr:Conserved oligomeric Golgi complex subunit 7 [Phytophthora cactorum]